MNHQFNDFLAKLGNPITNVVDGITNAYPSNEDLDLAYETEDGAVLNDARSLKRNRNILSGFLVLVLGGLLLALCLLVFTKMGAKVRKKLKLKVATAYKATRKRAKRTYKRARRTYRKRRTR